MMDDEEGAAEAAAPPANVWEAWRFWAPRAVLEAVLIVLSLLLALWLSDWQDQRRISRDVAETRAALVAEIRANREMLVSNYLLPHHHRLQAGLRRALEEGRSPEEVRQGAFALFETGVHFPTPRDAVWRTASASGVLQHMDREEVFALADVYGAQDSLMRTGAAYYPLALQLPGQAENPAALRGALTGTMLFMGDLIGGEETIVRLQTEALVALGAEEAATEATPTA